MGLGGWAVPRKRRENPETPITRQIREFLALMGVTHFKHHGGLGSEPGVPDLVGHLKGSGRALYIEVKVPGGKASEAQTAFIMRARETGALAFVATNPWTVVRRLAEAGYEPAKRMLPNAPKEEAF